MMKEVAGWLRSFATEKTRKLPFIDGEHTESLKRDIYRLKYLARQIEDMRCETCQWWLEYEEGCHPRYPRYPVWQCMFTYSEGDYSEIDNCGPYFCCNHWKGQDDLDTLEAFKEKYNLK